MQDIRELARFSGQAILNCSDTVEAVELAHEAIRRYAVDLLMNLAQAMRPTTDEERAAVAWLAQEVVRVARQILEA